MEQLCFGGVLGVKEQQIHRKGQMQQWINKGMLQFNPSFKSITSYPDYHAPITDNTKFVRAYLDVNCSSCHRPQGPTPINIDLRFTTKLEDMNLIDVDSLDVDAAGLSLKRLVKGNAEDSTLYRRMNTTDASRMPRLGTQVIDERSIKEIKKWIEGLK